MEWNELEGGENTFSSANDENILGFIILETKIAMLFLLSPFLFFFPRHCLPKPRRNQFNRQIIGIPEPGNFSRTDSTRCGSIKLEASPFLSLGDRFLSGKGGEEEEEERRIDGGGENLHLSKSKSS